jgi:hypothetical protein
VARIASRMAQPATMRSARSGPMVGAFARSLAGWAASRRPTARIASTGTAQPSTSRRS